MGSILGVQKAAAKKAGCSLEHYISQRAAGNKWCTRCKSWLHEREFGIDNTRADGFSATCLDCRKAHYQETYQKRGRTSTKGRRFAAVLDGNKAQARGRVNHLVKIGAIPDPDSQPCKRCGHLGPDRRHEYHHEGYGADQQESVECLCAKCHSREHKHWKLKTRDSKGRFHGTNN